MNIHSFCVCRCPAARKRQEQLWPHRLYSSNSNYSGTPSPPLQKTAQNFRQTYLIISKPCLRLPYLAGKAWERSAAAAASRSVFHHEWGKFGPRQSSLTFTFPEKEVLRLMWSETAHEKGKAIWLRPGCTWLMSFLLPCLIKSFPKSDWSKWFSCFRSMLW